MSSSGGGGAFPIAATMPSAGLTINPGRVGVTRQGSRKKYAIHRVAISPTHPAGDHSRKSTSVTIAAMAMNFQPSGWIGAITCRIMLTCRYPAPYPKTLKRRTASHS
jgi:hypothetical protein